jgi:hypothetical protein
MKTLKPFLLAVLESLEFGWLWFLKASYNLVRATGEQNI